MPDDNRTLPAPTKPASLPIARRFDSACEYETRTLTDPATKESFAFEVPCEWSDQAATIFATKYRRKTGVPQHASLACMPWRLSLESDPSKRGYPYERSGGETSARQIFGRLAGAWAYWGRTLGYFNKHDAQLFREDLTAMMEQQVAAPNSPQWFNTGLHWAYGIEGKAQGHYAERCVTSRESQACAFDSTLPTYERSGRVGVCTDAYTRPQVHACFIQGVEDNLVGDNGIMDLMQREARLFKFGSGTGTNYSNLRGEGEGLEAGGTSSGVLSFLRVSDRSAGAIKSGGTTRRAARMVVLDIDHPDVEDYIDWKAGEEDKVRVLRDAGIGNGRMDDEAVDTVSGQNGNNSVRLTDAFMQAVEEDGDFNLTYRTTGEVAKTVRARDLWDKICDAAWKCAAPGLHFADTINAWHTCIADGEITASNPCSEYVFLNDTACNLASLNLVKFQRADGTFDDELYRHAVRLWSIVLDISVSMAGYPSKQIAERSIEYRTLGLGYANLGGALMRTGVPYDSDKGRRFGAHVSSLLGAFSWQTSAELAQHLGPFPAYERNKASVTRVLEKHYNKASMGAAGVAWAQAVDAARAHGVRNAQCTLLAPTGTIGLIMDCDSTGVEPVYALSMTKVLAGGGTMVIDCPAAEQYKQDNYPEIPDYRVLDCANDIHWRGHLGMMAAAQPFLCGAISKTVNMPRTATAQDISDVYKTAHTLELKAVAIYRDKSKATQVLTADDSSAEPVNSWHNDPPIVDPNLCKPSPIDEFVDAAEHAVAFTYQGAPLVNTFTGVDSLARGEREAPPTVRAADTAKLKIGGETHHATVGRYEDGRVCEVFLHTGKHGGAVQGLADAFAIALSIGLQHGVPLQTFIDKFRYQNFAPAGFVADAPRGITSATSPVDAVAQLLAALTQEPSPAAAAEPAPTPRVSAPAEPVASSRVDTGAVCSACGGTDLQPAGACLTCRTCGATTGCG